MTHWIFAGMQSNDDYKMQAICLELSSQLKIDLDDLKGKSHKRNIVEPRQIAMYFIRKNTKLSLKDIGAYFGNRHHTTVYTAKETVKQLIQTDKEFCKKIVQLDRLFNN